MRRTGHTFGVAALDLHPPCRVRGGWTECAATCAVVAVAREAVAAVQTRGASASAFVGWAWGACVCLRHGVVVGGACVAGKRLPQYVVCTAKCSSRTCVALEGRCIPLEPGVAYAVGDVRAAVAAESRGRAGASQTHQRPSGVCEGVGGTCTALSGVTRPAESTEGAQMASLGDALEPESARTVCLVHPPLQ